MASSTTSSTTPEKVELTLRAVGAAPVAAGPDSSSSEHREAWDAERTKVLKQCLTGFLLPQFEAEVRREMFKVASDAAIIG